MTMMVKAYALRQIVSPTFLRERSPSVSEVSSNAINFYAKLHKHATLARPSTGKSLRFKRYRIASASIGSDNSNNNDSDNSDGKDNSENISQIPGINLVEDISSELKSSIDKLLSDEESQELFKDLNAAAERVKKAREAIDELDRKEKEAMQARLEFRIRSTIEAESKIAESEVSNAELRVIEAQKEMEEAERNLVMARAGVIDTPFSKEEERIESIKAAIVAAISGTIASIPFTYLSSNNDMLHFIVSEGIIAMTCALFGLTYRYIIQSDLENVHLKGGAIAAFALVRGLAQVEVAQLDGYENVMLALLNAGENVILIALSALSIDYCLKERILRPYTNIE